MSFGNIVADHVEIKINVHKPGTIYKVIGDIVASNVDDTDEEEVEQITESIKYVFTRFNIINREIMNDGVSTWVHQDMSQ